MLFEDVLSGMPGSSVFLDSIANSLVSPTVKIVEEDCGTLLGEIVVLDFEKEGLVELATGVSLSRARITQLLGQGKYKVATRSLHSCISKNGICRKCYESLYLGETAPIVNTQVNLEASLNYQTDVVIGNGYSKDYVLTQSDSDFDKVIIFKNGVIQTTGFSIAGSTLSFPSNISYSDVYTVRFYRITSEPLQGYMARSYSGDLLGMKPLPTTSTIIRESLYPSIIPDSILTMMAMELAPFKAIPSTYLEYIDRIHDKLEKALFILYLYAIFSNIQI